MQQINVPHGREQSKDEDEGKDKSKNDEGEHLAVAQCDTHCAALLL
jgi:hypothetical protein